MAGADSDMLEREYARVGATGTVDTKEFSFNTEHQTTYRIDFAKMTRTNTVTSTSRQLRRTTPVAPVDGSAAPLAPAGGLQPPDADD